MLSQPPAPPPGNQLRLILLVTALAAAGRGWAQEPLPPAGVATRPAQPAAADPAALGRETVTDIYKSLSLPGLGAAVVRDGKIVLEEYVGFADLEHREPVEDSSLFRVGSCSKLLTATAMVRLKQKGKLDIDAPLSRYLGSVPEDKAAITARQIAGHLGGFAHYGRGDYLNATHYEDVKETLPRYLGTPLVAPPGTKYAYSSYGYNVLGAVLQAAARREFRAVVQSEVTGPLGMSHTQAEDSSRPPRKRAHLYSKDDKDAFIDAPATDLTDRWPSGGFLSTAADLARLGAGVLQPKFLDPNAREEMFTLQKTADGAETKVGLGWRVARDEAGRRYVHHGGDSVGGRAFLLVYPDEKIAVALTTNLTFASLGEKEARRLAECFLRR